MTKDIIKVSINESTKIKTPYGNLFSIINPKVAKFTELAMGISTLEIGKKQKLKHEFSQELVFVLEGTCNIVFENKKIEINKYDTILIPKNVEYEISNYFEKEVKVIYCATPLALNPINGHKYIGE